MNSAHKRTKNRSRLVGMTLLDVMITTVIIAILGSIGVNGYQKYVARTKRPETLMTFRALALAQREYLLTQGTFAGTFDALGFRVEAGERISPTEIKGRRYTYSLIQDQGPRSWYCVASGNIDGDPFPDIVAASNPR